MQDASSWEVYRSARVGMLDESVTLAVDLGILLNDERVWVGRAGRAGNFTRVREW